MALSSGALKDLIIGKLATQGFITAEPHSKVDELVEAIATAVVTHITAEAEVNVAGGSSSGIYKVA